MDSRLTGYAALYGSETTIAGVFREVIQPGAFRGAIGRDDVRALYNHDPNYVLGRTKAGTLTLSEDARGLRYDVALPDTTWAKDLHTSIKRGDISQSSFSFRVHAETWTTDVLPLRTLVDLELFDVSPVTYPAYSETTVAARSADSVEFRGGGIEARSIADSLDAVRRLQLLTAAPSKCERCRLDTASRLLGEREGRRLHYRAVCHRCGERLCVDRRARYLRGGDRSTMADRLRRLALAERTARLAGR